MIYIIWLVLAYYYMLIIPNEKSERTTQKQKINWDFRSKGIGKSDIQYQIDEMQETINCPKTMTREERYGGPIHINRNKGWFPWSNKHGGNSTKENT